MEEVIIYGAVEEVSHYYHELAINGLNVIFYVDKDPEKIGHRFMGREIKSPGVLEKFKDIPVYVACRRRYREVYDYLKSIGATKIRFLGDSIWCRRVRAELAFAELNLSRCINLGKLLMTENGSEIDLGAQPYIHGGSGIMDYAFLKCVCEAFKVEGFCETGTYIGTSIGMLSPILKRCYSITAKPGSEYSMSSWCRKKDMPDYSDRLAQKEGVKHIYKDSKNYDYEEIAEGIGLYFIDADHSYNGVYCDTSNVFRSRDEDSFVIWHDFWQDGSNDDVVLAVMDALGKRFENVYCVDNNLCGIYIPPKYKHRFPLTQRRYIPAEEKPPLYTYETSLKISCLE